MSDGMLSQEEIDALLTNDENQDSSDGGNSSASQEGPEPAGEMYVVSLEEQDTLGEIGNISMGSAATALSTLLNKKVVITTPTVTVSNRIKFAESYLLPFVVVQVRYTEGLSGANVLFIKEEDACIIADLMMGGDGRIDMNNVSVNEIMLSAVGEAMNQMVGSATTSISSMFKLRIDIEPPIVSVAEMKDEILNLDSLHDEIVCIKFKMEIEDLINSELIQMIPFESVQDIMNLARMTAEISSIEAEHVRKPVVNEGPKAAPAPAPQPQPTPVAAQPTVSVPQGEAPISGPPPNYGARYDSQIGNARNYDVQQVQFAPLQENVLQHLPQNIDLIMDVPLDVSVELGKTRKIIKDVLELQQGSIIQLEKMAGEPVDMLVNGKLIAKGEVVVIDEYYGIRITTILSPIDRVNRLQ